MTEPKWKATPKAKIYEAWSALADGRVAIVGEGSANVESSDRSKTYTVIWTADRRSFGANDNASYWAGYMGYPILAVLMHLGLITTDRDIVQDFEGINWKQLNQIYKRNYDQAVDYIITQIEKRRSGSADRIRTHADKAFTEFKSLGLGRISPPGEPPART